MNEIIKSPHEEYADWKAPNTGDKETTQSSREYNASPVIAKEIAIDRIVYHNKSEVDQNYINPDSKVCLIGDGQGADTLQFSKMGVKNENISSINYEQKEVDAANSKLGSNDIKMMQGDATNIEDLEKAGIHEESQDYVVMMHVLEVPNIKGDNEKQLVENLTKILKPGGEALISQYKEKLDPKEAERLGVERNRDGILFSELSNIRTKEELIDLFKPYFDIELEENQSEYILRMKKK